jgi:SET domain-containing protein
VNAYNYISKNIFVKLKPSKVDGVGVFAIRDIPKNTFLFETWKGDSGYFPIKEKELQKLPKDLYNHIKDIFLYSPDFPNDTNTYIQLTNGCHWIYTTPYYFVNSDINKSNIDKTTFKTTRDIKRGEEILSNYGRYERLQKEELI